MSLRDLLRPPPHRGPVIAAGGVSLAVGVALTVLRLQDTLPIGVDAALLLVPGALLFFLGAQAPNEQGEPPAYQSVLLCTGLPLLYGGLLLALGGALDEVPPTWVIVIVSVLIAGVALWPAFARNSAISLLLAALLGAVAIEALAGETVARWLLLAYAGALVLAALALRLPARRHSEVLLDAAGIAIAWLAVASWDGLPWFFEVVVLGAGLGLVAFGALDRSPGPAYLGVVNLILFIAAAARGDTLWFWPVLLLVAGVLMLAAGLRPRRPLPPEPDPYRAGEAPLAARVEEPPR
jgi:hypothetical protein